MWGSGGKRSCRGHGEGLLSSVKEIFWESVNTGGKMLRKGRRTGPDPTGLLCRMNWGVSTSAETSKDSLGWKKGCEKVRLTLASKSERVSPWLRSQKWSHPKGTAASSYCQSISIAPAKGLTPGRLHWDFLVHNKMFCGLVLMDAADFCKSADCAPPTQLRGDKELRIILLLLGHVLAHHWAESGEQNTLGMWLLRWIPKCASHATQILF